MANQWFVRRKALTAKFLNTILAGGAVVMVSPLIWCEGEFGGRAAIVRAGLCPVCSWSPPR